MSVSACGRLKRLGRPSGQKSPCGSFSGTGWLISTYAVLTLAELCLSPMGLSVVSKLAPVRHAGLAMGGWFAATAVGSYLSGALGSFWKEMLPSTCS